MSSEIDGTVGGIVTEERVLGRRAVVSWSQDAVETFTSATSRALVIAALEREMIACGQATLYYQAADIDRAYVVFASSEAETAIHITVRIGQPMILDPALIAFLREFYAAQGYGPEG